MTGAKKNALRIVVLSLALLAVGLVMLSRFNFEGLKQEAVRIVFEKTQRNLNLDGDLSLIIFPRPGVQVRNASLSEWRSKSEFLAVDRVRVSINLLDLLSRRLVIEQVEIEGLRAHAVRRSDGSYNFDDLLKAESNEKSLLSVDLSRVALKDAAFSYHDERSGKMVDLRDVSLQIERGKRAALGTVRLVGRLGSEPLASRFAVRASWGANVTEGRYTLSNLEATLKGNAENFRSLDIGVSAANLSLGTKANEALLLDSLALKGAALSDGGALKFELEAPKLTFASNNSSGEAVRARLQLIAKDAEGTANFEASEWSSVADVLNVGKVNLLWSARRETTLVSGQVDGSLTLDMRKINLIVPKLRGEVLFEHPLLRPKNLRLPFNASMQGDLDRQRLVGNFNTTFDVTTANGAWRLTSFSPFVLDFELLLDQIDIDRYFKPPTATEAITSSDEPVVPAQASSVVHGNVQVADLQLFGARIKNFKAITRLQNGALAFESEVAAKSVAAKSQKK